MRRPSFAAAPKRACCGSCSRGRGSARSQAVAVALDGRRPPGGAAQRPHPAGPGGPLRPRRGGGDAREGGLLRRARPLDRHLPRAGAHVLQGHRAPRRGRDRPRDQERGRLSQRQHDVRPHRRISRSSPPSSLAEALDIQADALRHSVLDEGELARELQVIIQEAKRKLDSPSSVAYETLHEVMFDRHRIRRWRIGHEAQLAGFTRADVHGYYASRYVPERTIVAIVGAVDPDRALALAREAYGEWPAASGAVDPSPEEPDRREVRARTLRGDVSQAELSLGWRAAPPLAPRRAGARPGRRGARLGPRQLALPRAAGAGARHLDRRALLRADRAGALRRRS